MKVKNILISFLDHIFLFRIPLLAPVWTVFLYGVLSANTLTIQRASSHMALAMIAFSVLVGGIYIINQIFDVESDKANNKLFILPYKLVSIKTAWVMAITSIILALVFAFWASLILGVIFLAGAIVGIFYNCPPFELKNKAVEGLLSNSIGHGFLTFCAGWFSVADYNFAMWYPAIAVSFANGAVYLCTTIPDLDGDKSVNKSTFAVKFGSKATARMATLLEILTIVFSVLSGKLWWILAVASVLSLPFCIYISLKDDLKNTFRAFKVPVFIFTLSLFYKAWWYGVLIVLTFLLSRIYYKKRFDKDYPTFKSE